MEVIPQQKRRAHYILLHQSHESANFIYLFVDVGTKTSNIPKLIIVH